MEIGEARGSLFQKSSTFGVKQHDTLALLLSGLKTYMRHHLSWGTKFIIGSDLGFIKKE